LLKKGKKIRKLVKGVDQEHLEYEILLAINEEKIKAKIQEYKTVLT
jgi:hypothetical protein